MKKSELTEEFIIEGWLKKYHGITVKDMVDKHPKLCKTSLWYEKYPVTQEQHNDWYDWAIDIISKTLRMSKKNTKRRFCFSYLNCAPNIKR